jgi:hypothetical protein
LLIHVRLQSEREKKHRSCVAASRSCRRVAGAAT